MYKVFIFLFCCFLLPGMSLEAQKEKEWEPGDWKPMDLEAVGRGDPRDTEKAGKTEKPEKTRRAEKPEKIKKKGK